MEKESIELNGNTVFIDGIAESIFDKASSKFSDIFDEADLAFGEDAILEFSFIETKTNANECQQLLKNVKQIVNESYSELFDVSIERQELNDSEFPDDVADITINLNWEKIYKNA
jgi:hypothetical protein